MDSSQPIIVAATGAPSMIPLIHRIWVATKKGVVAEIVPRLYRGAPHVNGGCELRGCPHAPTLTVEIYIPPW